MTADEQKLICAQIAISCCWGHGGIASVILERLDKALPSSPAWGEIYRQHYRDATRQHIGVIDDEEELNRRLSSGYWLCNFDDDGCSLFNPPPMNGLEKYVSKRLADKYNLHRRGSTL